MDKETKPRYRVEFVTFGESYIRFCLSTFQTYSAFCGVYGIKKHIDKGTHCIYTFISKIDTNG